MRDPNTIVRAAARTLDLGQPVALIMLGILGNVADHDEARSISSRLLAAVSPGSYLVLNDGANTSAEHVEAQRAANEAGHPYHLRSPDQIARFFDGLELVEPGLVSTPRWRPESGVPAELPVRCGVARKP
ncbi:hypothetical protein H4W31_007366 [Plantactinospora soyae]|uniref:S-adenosyl methyltransferase n=1 Tax=Plantactinospora soyae TaxID=1544732 RepID=A0A927R3E0_9ACTN|nr:hypothetical protein [Plantactinospora soyae]